MIVLLNMHLTSKICDKFCLKAIRDALFPICGLQSGEGQEGGYEGRGRLNTLVEGASNRRGDFQDFWHEREGCHSS